MTSVVFRSDAGVALVAGLRAADDTVAALSSGLPAVQSLTDAELLEAGSVLGSLRDRVLSRAALVAGEIARRSAPDLGSRGLAQRTGFRTPIDMVKATTGATAREATTAVQLGTLMVETASEGRIDEATGEVSTPTKPWLKAVATALQAQQISVAAAEAIAHGLGVLSSAIDNDALARAASQLVLDAALRSNQSMHPDQLLRRARQVRDELDAGGVSVREAERRAQRSFRISVLPDGMGRAVWVMDPETLASVKDVYDRATSPKLGGVRFVSGESAEKAEDILADPRTPQQLASDAMEQVLRLGADTDPQFLLGSGAPVVKVIVTKAALEAGASAGVGLGRLEGHPDPVSLPTVERLRCTGDTIGIIFNQHGQPLDVGREHRLFTRRQRAALAVRDGGCRAPGCDRPPSWCEAHHVQAWGLDRGGTDVANGILLCKHHHLLFHANGWQIRHQHGNYWLIPPPDIDPKQTPLAMPSKSAAMRDLEGTG
jgi:hypothetical protein